MGFRFDINGLRTIAVLGVILFHFQIPFFQGGFAGVDVFFVISGFLMTGIIFRKVEADNFSLLGFYADRIRRIVPALVVVCFVVLLVGCFILSPDIYHSLAKHTKYSLRFLSNTLYLRESGYFDTASHEKWLLHTWSLSVEWQFYIIYPILVIALKKFLPVGKIKGIIILMALVSFILCLLASLNYEAKAFYLLQFRAWEMLLGGVVYLFPLSLKPGQKWGLSLFGLALILVSLFAINAAMQWPGYLALLPVMGAALFISANNQSMPVINSKVFQFLGKISYSLYLWHWPIYAALYYFDLNNDPAYIILGIALAFVLSVISYYCVEMPFTDKTKRKRFYGLLVGFAITYGLSSLVYNTDGLLFMANQNVSMSYHAIRNVSPYTTDECSRTSGGFDGWCITDKGRPVDLLAIGDSHSNTIITAISDGLNKNVKFMSYAGCLVIPSIKRLGTSDSYRCGEYAEAIIKDLNTMDGRIPLLITHRTSGHVYDSFDKPNIKPAIYFTQPYDSYSPEFFAEFENRYIAMACDLAKHRDVYIVLPIPEQHENALRELMKQYTLGKKPSGFSVKHSEYDKRNAFAISVMEKARDQCGVKLLDPTKFLCDENECSGLHDGVTIYSDDNHLNEVGNKLLSPMFSEIWQKHLTAAQ